MCIFAIVQKMLKSCLYRFPLYVFTMLIIYNYSMVTGFNVLIYISLNLAY